MTNFLNFYLFFFTFSIVIQKIFIYTFYLYLSVDDLPKYKKLKNLRHHELNPN